jgi:hypothetical protein
VLDRDACSGDHGLAEHDMRIGCDAGMFHEAMIARRRPGSTLRGRLGLAAGEVKIRQHAETLVGMHAQPVQICLRSRS